jgi:uncharacterized protein YbcI
VNERGPISAATVLNDRTRHSDDLTRLCGEAAGIVRRSWGRGPVKTTAHWAGPSMLVLVFEDGHTEAEKALRAGGHLEALRTGRRLLLELVEDDLSGAVETVAGRPVLTMLGATRLDPDLSAAIFLLGDAASMHQGPTARARELLDETQALRAEHRQVQRNSDQRRRWERGPDDD